MLIRLGFIQILVLLPNLNMIQLSELPFYDDIYESNPNINAINQFLINNKINTWEHFKFWPNESDY